MRIQYNLECINLQTNVDCPLNCPNCYQSSTRDMRIDLTHAIELIHEASELGVKYINILGGETLLYPHINDILKVCVKNNICTHIATSGINIDRSLMKSLFSLGLNKLFISLDGSCAKINSTSRNGYNYAVNAFKLGGELFPDKVIALWVFNSKNIYDFNNYLVLLKNLNIHQVCILKLKYYHGFDKFLIPTFDQLKYIKRVMIDHSNCFTFYPDTCWNELVNMVQGRKIYKSNAPCEAGRKRCSINADGTFSPCPHLSIREQYNSLSEYWQFSYILSYIRSNSSFRGCSN